MKLSTVSARTVSVSRWFHSTPVLTQNECFGCSVLQCSTMKLLLLFDMCLSKMFFVSQLSKCFAFTCRFCLVGFRNSFGGIAITRPWTSLYMKISLFEQRRFSNDDSSNDWSIPVTQHNTPLAFCNHLL